MGLGCRFDRRFIPSPHPAILTGTEYVIFFVHLVLGVFPRHDQLGVVRQVKRKEASAYQSVQRVVVRQKSRRQYPDVLQQLYDAVHEKYQTATFVSLRGRESEHKKTMSVRMGRFDSIVGTNHIHSKRTTITQYMHIHTRIYVRRQSRTPLR